MNDKESVEFFKANPYAKTLVLALAEEYKPEKVTTVSGAVAILEAHGISVSYSQIIALFRQIEGFGCGTFFVGRKGKRSRLYWSIEIKTLGEALEDSSSSGVSSSKASAPHEGSATASSNPILRHTFHLRQDFELILNLPADLTEKDAQRISKFVESLPQ